LNNYLFLGLFLGAAIVAGVVMYMAAPKDNIFFDNYGLMPQSDIQTKLQQDYYKGLVDKADNSITNESSNVTTGGGNYTLRKINTPTSARVNAA
jgi:hypothetical protein